MKLFHQKYTSIDELIADNNFGSLDIREKDLLAVMLTLSNATLALVTDEHQKLITDAVRPTREINPPVMQLIVDLGHLTQRIRR